MSEWIRSCWSQDFPIRFDTTYADVYDLPEQSNYPIPSEFSRDRFDRFIPEAEETNGEYKAVLMEIKKQYYANHPGEKPDPEDEEKRYA